MELRGGRRQRHIPGRSRHLELPADRAAIDPRVRRQLQSTAAHLDPFARILPGQAGDQPRLTVDAHLPEPQRRLGIDPPALLQLPAEPVAHTQTRSIEVQAQ